MWGEDVGRIMRGVVGWQPTNTAKLGRSPLIGGKNPCQPSAPLFKEYL